MTLEDAIQQGDYQSAIELLDAELKASTDPGKLFMSVELKCFLQDFDGAITDLERLAQDVSYDNLLKEFRPVIANAQTWCHRQTIAEFPNQRASICTLPDYSMLFDDALRLHAAADHSLAKTRLDQAKPLVPKAGGELQFWEGNSLSFADLWDADDLTGPHLVCSHPQALLDIPFAQISEVEFLPVPGFQYTLWKPCIVRTQNGDETRVHVFSYYVDTGKHEFEHIRKLRMTQFERDTGYCVGYGQRDWQVTGEDNEGSISLVGIHGVQKITFRSQHDG
jgi:protein involved in temperature-dependent protein secretion